VIGAASSIIHWIFAVVLWGSIHSLLITFIRQNSIPHNFCNEKYPGVGCPFVHACLCTYLYDKYSRHIFFLFCWMLAVLINHSFLKPTSPFSSKFLSLCLFLSSLSLACCNLHSVPLFQLLLLKFSLVNFWVNISAKLNWFIRGLCISFHVTVAVFTSYCNLHSVPLFQPQLLLLAFRHTKVFCVSTKSSYRLTFKCI